jgi:inorganic pyrophosphatase
MQKRKLSAGDKVPDCFNVMIEISMNESQIKYEFDKELETLRVDRFFKAPMYYPFNYGYIPGTCGGDGDPLDVMLVAPYPIVPCALIECRPIGVLLMDDESGRDEKIIAVPHQKIYSAFADVNSLEDLHLDVKEKIEHFFSYYKAMDKGKWVKIERWGSVEEAKSLIKNCITPISG